MECVIERRIVVCRCSLLICACLVTVASVMPQVSTGSTKVFFSVGLDKILHFLAFGTVGFFTIGGLEKPSGWRVLAALACAALFGGFIESVQFFIPGRTFNPLDIAANLLGLLLGALAWQGVIRFVAQRR